MIDPEVLFGLQMRHGTYQFVASVGPKPGEAGTTNSLGRIASELQKESLHIGWVSVAGFQMQPAGVIVRWETDQPDHDEAVVCSVTGLIHAVSHLEVPSQVTKISMDTREDAAKIKSDLWLAKLHDITPVLAEFDTTEPDPVIWPSDEALWREVWTVSPVEDAFPIQRLSFE